MRVLCEKGGGCKTLKVIYISTHHRGDNVSELVLAQKLREPSVSWSVISGERGHRNRRKGLEEKVPSKYRQEEDFGEGEGHGVELRLL